MTTIVISVTSSEVLGSLLTELVHNGQICTIETRSITEGGFELIIDARALKTVLSALDEVYHTEKDPWLLDLESDDPVAIEALNTWLSEHQECKS